MPAPPTSRIPEEEDEDNDVQPSYPFKKSNFAGLSGKLCTKKRTWKSLKQILALEKSALSESHSGIGLYTYVDAPPSRCTLPRRSDISGRKMKYIDPSTKIYYTDVEEYAKVKNLSEEAVNGYLTLRKGNQNII